jgi:hypothetical protein
VSWPRRESTESERMVLEAAMASMAVKSAIHPRSGWRRTTVVCAPKLRHVRQTLDLV